MYANLHYSQKNAHQTLILNRFSFDTNIPSVMKN